MSDSILNTVTGWPDRSVFDSFPVSPSNGCPVGEVFPDSLYKNPSMWSNDRFSSMSTTTCSMADRPLPGIAASFARGFSLAARLPPPPGLSMIARCRPRRLLGVLYRRRSRKTRPERVRPPGPGGQSENVFDEALYLPGGQCIPGLVAGRRGGDRPRPAGRVGEADGPCP